MYINSNLIERPVVLKCPLWCALFYKKHGRLPSWDDAKLTGYITYAAYYNCMRRKAYVRYLSDFGGAGEFEVKEEI